MIKRSFQRRFRTPVRQAIKTTTIRDKPWPVGVRIMAFSWEAKPYRSKHADICPIIVERTEPILLTFQQGGDAVLYHLPQGPWENPRPLWATEGFNSQEDMDSWFLKIPGKKPKFLSKHLIHFRLQ